MSRPIELYRIAIDADVYTWTSGDENIVYAEETYTRQTIRRSDIEQTSEINRERLTLTVPRTNPLAALYLSAVPEYAATVTVFRQDAAETAVIWKGRIAGFSASGSEISFEVESVFTSLRRPGLRARYQRQCRHTLYGRGCNLVAATFAIAGTCTAATDAVVAVTEAAAQPDGWYLGGMCEYDGVLRSIVGHAGSALTLSRPLDELNADVAGAGSAAVAIYPGCNRLRATCADKFDNVANFGGFPWIPNKNPFGGQSII